MVKLSIKERLQKKSVAELDAIAKRLNYPARGIKSEKIRQLNHYLYQAKKDWDIIINGKHNIKPIDETCEIGQRVYWENFKGERFEGTLIKWKNGYWADVEKDDGTIIEFEF